MTERRSTGRAPVAFMSVKTQFDNLGDVLINRELALALSRRGRTLVDFSRCPPAFRQAMAVDGLPNVEGLDRFGSIRLFLALLRARIEGRECFYFLNPGGLGGREFSPRQTVSASIYNLLLAVFGLIGVKVCLVGASFDPLKPRARAVMKTRLRNLFLIAVRDRLSIAHLEADGLRVDGLVPDLSFLAYAGPRDPEGRPAVAFSFRFDKGDETAFDAFVLAVAAGQGAGTPLKFVAQVARDAEPMRRLAERIAAAGHAARYLGCWTDLPTVDGYYADCRVIYSNRLHALLMATYFGVTPVAVVSGSANRKIEGIFADLGVERLVHRLGDPVGPALLAPDPVPDAALAREKAAGERFFDRLYAGASRATLVAEGPDA